jgi:hypothetical protein
MPKRTVLRVSAHLSLGKPLDSWQSCRAWVEMEIADH